MVCRLSAGSLGYQTGVGLKLSLVSSALLGATVAYLLFNYPVPGREAARTFMGDSGSMLLGLTIAWLLVTTTQLINPNAIGTSPSRPFTAAHALWLVALPLFDATACMVRRVYEGQTPMAPDRRHIHHLLIQRGVRPQHVAPILNTVSATMAAIGVLLWHQGIVDYVSLYLLAIAFAVYIYLNTHTWLLLPRQSAHGARPSVARK